MTSRTVLTVTLAIGVAVPLSAQSPATAPRQAKPASAKPASPKTTAVKSAKPVRPVSTEPEVLTNDAVVRMVASGLDEETVAAKIKAAASSSFQLDTDNLIKLKQANIPQRVLRAMLAKSSPPAEPAAAAPVTVVKDPGPAIAAAEPAPPPLPSAIEQVMVRQKSSLLNLTSKPQKVMFIKSEAGDLKSAVANILLSDVGLQLLTMGMSSQMAMWNPYMGDTIQKAASAGKGMILNRGTDTKGFEIETLPGITADTTLNEGKAEFYVPVNRYLPSANFDPATMEPVILRLQIRDKEQSRVLSGRKVTLKQEKKGRFDFKPDTQRLESSVEQTMIPVTVERLPDNVLKIIPVEELKRGEYSLVFRLKDPAGAYTSNVALKPDSKPAATTEDANLAAIPGMTPELAAMMGPEQIAALQQMQQQQNANARPQGGGLMGRMRGGGRGAAPPPPTPQEGPLTGFLAWDFRVLP